MLPHDAITIQNGLERSMKGGIIMVRRSHAGRKTHNSHMLETDARLALIQDWLSRELRLQPTGLQVASSDASFRRYFRAFSAGASYVVMDAPPEKEDVQPYLKVTRLLEALGAHVPHVHEADVARGLLLLEDLGTTPYLQSLQSGEDSERLYAAALEALANIQLRGAAACAQLAPYGRSELAREMALMPEWFLGRHLSLDLSVAERELLSATFEFLIAEALAQPRVFVHRDYHSRNLMVNNGQLYIIDFQDARMGPDTYDLASLLRDSYVDITDRELDELIAYFLALKTSDGASPDPDEFRRRFDLMALQRNLKALGTFGYQTMTRRNPVYIQYMPRTLRYVRENLQKYARFASLREILAAHIEELA
jgi:N-acetylmuramate 1-kinase